MSETTTIFGDDSMDYKNNFENDRVVAELYDVISNAYGDACNEGSSLKSFLKTVNGAVGSLQGNLDNIAASDVEEYKHISVSDYNGHAVPEGFHPEENTEMFKEMLQKQLRTHIGTKSPSQQVAGSGTSEPESGDDSEPEESESVSDMEPVFDRIADDDDGVSGIGSKTAEKLRKWIAVNEEEISHEEIDVEVTITDKYDSLNDVPAEMVTQLTTEEIEALQA